MTYEKAPDKEGYIFDVFSPDGFYMGRNTLNVLFRNGVVVAKAKDDRLYCVSEKDSGHKELRVYSMEWE